MAVAIAAPPSFGSAAGKRQLDLEMIYEEDGDHDPMIEEDGNSGNSLKMMRRTRSVPHEEFAYLSQKLKELDLIQRSGGSSRTKTDSGFNSEVPSCACGILEHASQQGIELPSALLASDLNSGFLAQYGLDGPLDVYPGPEDDEPEEPMMDLLGMPPAPSATSTTAKKKLKEEMKQATIRQHYYPEGGWGFVVLIVAVMVQTIAHGLQLSFGVLLLAIFRRWSDADFVQTSALGALSMSVGLLISPLTVGICKRKSTRITAVIGGLVVALGCLFSSFANQFHQLFFSHAVMTGIGVGLTRDTSTLMVAQYFKRKREFVEIFVVAASGLGISLLSAFLYHATSSAGWRLGLQQITGLVVTTFLLGTFYRSASLYHPQRRAILHLKTQKRKIKNKDKEKNKLQDDRPPFFEFTTLKSRTVQIMLVSTFFSHLGIFSPLIFLARQASGEAGQLTKDSVVQLQLYIGLSWAIGSVAFGLILAGQSTECRIARQYLTQSSLVMSGLSIFALTAVKGSPSGYVMFSWIYGAFNGGYAYTLKMYIYEKVRARNFARAWSFAQMAMGAGLVMGLPLAAFLSEANVNLGYHFSGTFVVLGGLVLSFVDVHKKRLRKKRRLRQCKSTASTATAATSTTFNSSSVHHHHLFNSHSQSIETPKNSFMAMDELPSAHQGQNMKMEVALSEANAIVGSTSIASADELMASKIYLVRSHSDAEMIRNHEKAGKRLQKLMSLDMMEHEEGEKELEDDDLMMIMEDEDELVFNDIAMDDFLEGITSCNKVENCVILSEFEQNDEVHAQSNANARRMRDPASKKWFFKKKLNGHDGKKWNQVLPGPSKEMTTVLEETSAV